MSVPDGKELYCAFGTSTITSPSNLDVSSLQPCNQDEVGTRAFLYAKDAATKGHQDICIKANDTDIIIIGIAHYAKIGCPSLWLQTGNKNNSRNIPIHEIFHELGPIRAGGLLLFHSLTGCDSTCLLGLVKQQHGKYG